MGVLLLSELFEDSREYLLCGGENVLLGSKAHFEIELMQESPLAVLCRNVGFYEED